MIQSIHGLLSLAALRGHAAAVEALLGGGAKANRQNPNNGRTALHWAAQVRQHSNTERLAVLYSCLHSLNDVVYFCSSQLCGARQRTLLAVVQLLLCYGWHLHPPYGRVTYTTDRACVRPVPQEGHLAVVQLLLRIGADPNILNDNKVSPLILASDRGHAKVRADGLCGLPLCGGCKAEGRCCVNDGTVCI